MVQVRRQGQIENPLLHYLFHLCSFVNHYFLSGGLHGGLEDGGPLPRLSVKILEVILLVLGVGSVEGTAEFGLSVKLKRIVGRRTTAIDLFVMKHKFVMLLLLLIIFLLLKSAIVVVAIASTTPLVEIWRKVSDPLLFSLDVVSGHVSTEPSDVCLATSLPFIDDLGVFLFLITGDVNWRDKLCLLRFYLLRHF